MVVALRVVLAATKGFCRVDSMGFFLLLFTELLCVLGVQSLPAVELHDLDADDSSDGLTGEMPLQHIEAYMPACGAHRDEAAVDVVPEREPGAVHSQRLQFPADILSAPVEFEHPGGVGPFHPGLGYERRRRPYGRQRCGAGRTEVPVRIERSPFAEMLGVRERLPDLRRRVMELADENERPL